VENAVLIVQRWILACLRNRIFYSLAELNKAIRELVDKINDRPMQHLKKSRRELFSGAGQAHALPLPAQPFEYRELESSHGWFDYHVQVDGNYYSTPWTLASQKVAVRLNGEHG